MLLKYHNCCHFFTCGYLKIQSTPGSFLSVFCVSVHESVWLLSRGWWWLEGAIIKSCFLNHLHHHHHHHRCCRFVLCCCSLRPQSAPFQAVSQLRGGVKGRGGRAVQPRFSLFASIIAELLVRVSVFAQSPGVSFDPRCPCQSSPSVAVQPVT